MNQSPSVRWLRASVAAFVAGVAMMAGAIADGATHGPGVLAVVFIVLMVVFAIVGFCLVLVASGKSRKENQQLVAQVRERTQAQARHDRRPR
jgi:RsiW-degrading membrane proteinase PrsW (M82 family)